MAKFTFNKDKFYSLLNLFCSKYDDVDKLKAVKLLYYIDKECLLSFGKPLIGDWYRKMVLGPVPSNSFDIIKNFPIGGTDNPDFYFAESDQKYPPIRTNNSPDLDVFSKVEIESINKVLEKYGSLPGVKLSDLSHEDQTWLQSKKNQPIDYRLFFEDNPSDSKQAYEAMLHEQEESEFLEDL